MPRPARGAGDVLSALRRATAADHERVEDALGLLDPGLRRDRLVEVLTRLAGFWAAAETGLDDWARREPRGAELLAWPRRRRGGLFAADLLALGAPPDPADRPELPAVAGTDEAVGRLYVLEGSTLGGAVVDRHLAALPHLGPGLRLHAFSPYGADTGAMWAAFRRAARARVAGGGDAGRIVGAARVTFRALAVWCPPPGVPAPGGGPTPPVRATVSPAEAGS